MAVSKANQRAVNKYVKANYDRVNVTLQKGQKDIIKSHAEAHGESANGFINRAITETMGRDNGASVASVQAERQGSILTATAAKAAQEAAERAGETVPAFVERAITTQADRDRMMQRLSGR